MSLLQCATRWICFVVSFPKFLKIPTQSQDLHDRGRAGGENSSSSPSPSSSCSSFRCCFPFHRIAAADRILEISAARRTAETTAENADLRSGIRRQREGGRSFFACGNTTTVVQLSAPGAPSLLLVESLFFSSVGRRTRNSSSSGRRSRSKFRERKRNESFNYLVPELL